MTHFPMTVLTKLRTILSICLLCAGPTLAVQAQIQRDFITMKGSSRPVSGTIERHSPDEIVVKSDGSSKRISSDAIERVRFADDPSGFRAIRDSIRSGQLERALEDLEKLRVPAESRDIVKQEIEYQRALATSKLALRGSGDLTAAARQTSSFIKRNPDSFRYYRACEVLGDLATGLGKYDAAAKSYRRLANSKSNSWKTRSTLLEAGALRSSGDFNAAAQLYQSVANAVSGAPESARNQAVAKIGHAACLAETGQHEQALEMIEEVIAETDSDDGDLLASAYNALGTCHRKANRPQDAVLAYLHVHLLFFRHFDAHAESLYYLSQLWPAAGKPGEATEARKMLTDQYAGTVWAKK